MSTLLNPRMQTVFKVRATSPHRHCSPDSSQQPELSPAFSPGAECVAHNPFWLLPLLLDKPRMLSHPPHLSPSHCCLTVSLTRTVRRDLLQVSRTPLIFLVHLAFGHWTLNVCLNFNVLYYNLTYCLFLFCTSD